MYSLCKNAWHLIDKIFSWIYLIKFLEVCLKYHSDLHSYRKYQNYVYGKREHNGAMAKKLKYDLRSIRPSSSCAKKQHMNHLHELSESNKACILIIIIIYHSVWSFNITLNIVIAVIIIIIVVVVVVVVVIVIINADWKYVSNCS